MAMFGLLPRPSADGSFRAILPLAVSGVAIPLSRELLERRGEIDEEALFRTAAISKRQVAAFMRLPDEHFLAHLTSGNSQPIDARSAPRSRSLTDRRGTYVA
jgi:hypothetical protein